MKYSLLSLVAVAGVAALVVSQMTGNRDYKPLRLEDQEPELYVPRAIPGAVPAGFEIAEMTVDGPCCMGCSGKLYTALLAVPGVEKASVVFAEEGTVTQALVPAGFDLEALELGLTFDKYSVRNSRVSSRGGLELQ